MAFLVTPSCYNSDMSSIRSVYDELASEDIRSAPIGQLEDDLVELRRSLDALEMEWLRRLALFDRRRPVEHDGILSTTSWLMQRCRLGSSAARDKLRLARALVGMPLAAVAVAEGEISHSHVRALAGAYAAHPEAYVDHEEVLVDAARSLPVRSLRTAIEYWRQNLDLEAALNDSQALYNKRRLNVSRTFMGMVRIDGDLDPDSGEIVLTALQALTDPANRVPDDDRTPTQRRVDALIDICAEFLNHGDAPQTGGEKPHISIVLDLASLEGRAGKRCEYDSGGVIHPETARRIACDAGIVRIITDGDSQPLDVGRRTRTISPAQRRALIIRDGGCRWQGCDRPPRWCDAHHRTHWANGGKTNLKDLVLLCLRHHIMVHEGRIKLRL